MTAVSTIKESLPNLYALGGELYEVPVGFAPAANLVDVGTTSPISSTACVIASFHALTLPLSRTFDL